MFFQEVRQVDWTEIALKIGGARGVGRNWAPLRTRRIPD
jgi:hypothetical protein